MKEYMRSFKIVRAEDGLLYLVGDYVYSSWVGVDIPLSRCHEVVTLVSQYDLCIKVVSLPKTGFKTFEEIVEHEFFRD